MRNSGRDLFLFTGIVFVAIAPGGAIAAKPLIQDYIDGAKSPPPVKAPYAGPEIELRYGLPGPAGSRANILTESLFQALERWSGGKIKVMSVAERPRPGFGEATDRTNDEVPAYSACLGDRGRSMTGFGISGLPGILPSEPHIGTRILNQVQARHFTSTAKGREQRMAPAAQIGSGYHLMSRRPIRRLADFTGARIAVPVRSTLPAVKAWGGIPVSIKSTGLFISVARGTTGSAYVTDRTMIASRLYKVLKYRTEIGLQQLVIPHCVASRWMAKLPRKLKRTFRLWTQFHAQALAQSDLAEPADRAIYAKSGVTTVKPPDRVLQQLRNAAASAADDWKTAAKSRGFDPEKLLASIAELRSQYVGKSPDEITALIFSKPIKGLPR